MTLSIRQQIEAKEKQIEKQKKVLQKLEAKEESEEKRRLTNRKIIIGGLALAEAERDARFMRLLARIILRTARESDKKKLEDIIKHANDVI